MIVYGFCRRALEVSAKLLQMQLSKYKGPQKWMFPEQEHSDIYRFAEAALPQQYKNIVT